MLQQELFPFKEYFADAPEQLFHGSSFAADMEKARGCFRHLRTMFQELEECRAFELLKVTAPVHPRDSNTLLTYWQSACDLL